MSDRHILDAGAAVAELVSCISVSQKPKASIILNYPDMNSYYSALAEIKQRLQPFMHGDLREFGYRTELTVSGVTLELGYKSSE